LSGLEEQKFIEVKLHLQFQQLNLRTFIYQIAFKHISLERMGNDVSPQQRIEDMIRVTELCIDLLKENEEHHGEVC
jgi:hypothetical protein